MEYKIILSVCTDITVKANSKEEAMEIAIRNYDDGKQELIDALEINGFEVEMEE